MKNSVMFAALGALMLLGAGRVAADSPAVSTANGIPHSWQAFAGLSNSCTVGWSFTIGAQDVQVNAIGLFDNGADGMADSHPVGLWSSGGTLLAQAVVPAGTAGTLLGSYRYAPIAPLTLAAGQTYVVGAHFVGGTADSILYLGTQSYDPRLSFLQSRQSTLSSAATSLQFPDLNASVAQGVFGPNLILLGSSPVQLQSFEID